VSLLRVEGVGVRFGGLAALKDVSLQVKKGEIVALIGPNGAGKTTLFNVVNGFTRPSSGRVLFKDEDVTGFKPHLLARRGLARTFQVVRPLARLTVLDNVVAAAFLRAQDKGHAERLARESLHFTGLYEERFQLAMGLPLGKRKRLEIARAMATQAELLLLDESFAGLNPSELDDSIGIIRRMSAMGLTIVIIEHHMKVIMAISDRVVVLNHGEKLAEGTPGEIGRDRKVIEAYLGEARHA